MKKEKTNMKVAINWIVGILFLGLLIFSGICLYKLQHQSPPEVIQITLRDTITIVHDSIITETKWRTKYDTCFIVKRDSVSDTVYVEIPIDYKKALIKQSKDSLDIEADIYYHGFKADIDSVLLMYNLHYTEEIPRPKEKPIGFVWYFGLGVNGGINMNFTNKTFDYGPSVGLQLGIGIGGKIK